MSPVIATCRHRSNTSKLAKVRALAVTTARRAEALPDLPTVGEFVPGYEARSGNGGQVGGQQGFRERDPTPGENFAG
jgi:hypothetical protein